MRMTHKIVMLATVAAVALPLAARAATTNVDALANFIQAITQGLDVFALRKGFNLLIPDLLFFFQLFIELFDHDF